MRAPREELVLAAGALVWRQTGAGLEVLLVHRPRYQDWSFPKGKLDPGESLRGCAVREVAEETGAQIVLGRPLGTLRYPLADGRLKAVSYWAAQEVPPGHPAWRAQRAVKPASPKEIDGVAWVGAAQARQRLTHRLDQELLDQLVGLWEGAQLATRTLVLLRHARAVKRSTWNRPENGVGEELERSRPLTATGKQRADAVVPELAAYGVTQVVTSPWRRCLDTVRPYLEAAGLEATTADCLTERAHAQDAAAVRDFLERLLAGSSHSPGAGATARDDLQDAVVGCGPGPGAGATARDDLQDVVVGCGPEPGAGVTVVCLHRPTLPTVLTMVAEHATAAVAEALPDADPWLKTGELLVLHLAETAGCPERGSEGREALTPGGLETVGQESRGRVQVVAIEQHHPPLARPGHMYRETGTYGPRDR
ncbi:NUDIX hydrolase [Actinomyces weissii]|uniref:NUDIX hydrolase n=1 Tax=Actinomyces weissii TaxID=675090 RepID=A0A7T7MBL6_9ACTO|nr:NUDIX hydrolase [Actinomyces weissii]